MDRNAPNLHPPGHGEGSVEGSSGTGGTHPGEENGPAHVPGREVDISPTYLSQIESGLRNPTVAALHGIANKLGVSLGELFEGL